MTFNFKISPYFILSTLVFMYSLQRLSSINLLGMSFAPADIFLVFSVVFFSKKVNIKHVFLSILVSIFLIILALINEIYAINSIITVSLKIYLATRLISFFNEVTPKKLDYIVTYFYFLILTFILIIFSENNPIFNYDLMNPNEGINYLITIWLLLAIMQLKEDEAFLKKNKYLVVPGLIILLVSIFLFTRQGIISLSLFFLLYILLNKNINTIKKFVALIPFLVVIALAIVLLQSLGDYNSQRIETLLTLDVSNTRSDQKRLDLIEYGINGFLHNPMGNGLSSFQINNSIGGGGVAHNFYASSLYELGLVGMSLIGLILSKAIKNLFVSRHQNNKIILIINIICVVFFFQLIFIEALGKIGIFLITGWVLSYNHFNSLNKQEI